MSPARVAVATLVAALGSGIPSTAHAVLTGGDPLAAARAAATLAPGRRHRPGLVVGILTHVVVSAAWGVVLGHLPRRQPVAWGAAAGLGIAAVDLGVVARRYPAVRALPLAPQVADHVAFGALFGWALGWSRPVLFLRAILAANGDHRTQKAQAFSRASA